MTRHPVLMLALCGLMASLAACYPVRVGDECTSDDACAPGQRCQATTGGFCTRGCLEPGATSECPGGTVCTTFGTQALVCSPTCEGDADCRDGYECVSAGGVSALKACRPNAS